MLFDVEEQSLDAHTRFVSCRFNMADLGSQTAQELAVPLPASLAEAVPKRRAEYLAGRYCAAMATKALLGHWVVPTAGNRREPIWPDGVCGSITHTHGYAASLVSKAPGLLGVGLDSEKVVSDKTLAAVAATIVTSDERMILKQAELEENTAVTLAFSAKESVYKAYHGCVQTFFYFDAVAVQAIDREAGILQLAFVKDVAQVRSGTQVRAYFSIDHMQQLVHTRVLATL